jgi:hypothetical protein
MMSDNLTCNCEDGLENIGEVAEWLKAAVC